MGGVSSAEWQGGRKSCCYGALVEGEHFGLTSERLSNDGKIERPVGGEDRNGNDKGEKE